MTTGAIPHRLVIQSFFWPFTAEHIAFCFSRFYGRRVTAAQIMDIWIEESTWNPMLQQNRPKNGFPQNEETKLMERLAA